MPLPPSAPRREIHHRIIDMRAYQRDDGLYDVEAHLVDTKPFDFERLASTHRIPPGTPLHDLWVRLTVDDDYIVRDIRAASDVTPFPLCKEAETSLRVLVGEPIARGWTNMVKERLRGAASCTHLMEMLIPLATTALQGIRGIRPAQDRRPTVDGVPSQIDTCYGYKRDGEVVARFWPEHHKASR